MAPVRAVYGKYRTIFSFPFFYRCNDAWHCCCWWWHFFSFSFALSILSISTIRSEFVRIPVIHRLSRNKWKIVANGAFEAKRNDGNTNFFLLLLCYAENQTKPFYPYLLVIYLHKDGFHTFGNLRVFICKSVFNCENIVNAMWASNDMISLKQ